jgi:predicted MPP superfamily phosphohydrolase
LRDFIKSFIFAGVRYLSKKKIWFGIFLILCFFFYVLCVEPFWIQIKEVTIRDKTFSPFFKTYKTILISDLHASKIGLRERLLIKKINEISPDIILLAGDYVAWGGDYEKAFDLLSRLKVPVGIWGVLGDSDDQNSRKACQFCHTFSPNMKALPVLFLRNETVYLTTENSHIAISGIELFNKDLSSGGIKILQRNLGCPEIVLSQKQVDLSKLPDRPIFVLSGDTHGGQVYTPEKIWNKFFSLSKGNIRIGLVKEGQRMLFVTSGIGTNRIPIRFLCPPEIVIFKGE